MNFVWRELTQEELDRAYNQSDYAPNREQTLARYASNSAITRHRIGSPERLRYGGSEKEGIDYFHGQEGRAPCVIFIHGGAWRSGTAANYAFLAEIFIKAESIARCLISIGFKTRTGIYCRWQIRLVAP